MKSPSMLKLLALLLALLGAVADSARAATLIDTNATWRFRKGQSEASLPDIAPWRF
jgi:hypothetical protein